MSSKGEILRNHEELIGKKFGRLTVTSIYETGRTFKYNTLCDCGNEKIVYKKSLIRGETKSCGCLKFKPNSETSFKKVFWTYKNNAIKRDYNFSLSEIEFKTLTKQNCYYCGSEPNNICKTTKYQPDYIYNGIDRINNKIGYTLDNCVPCCKICNQAKTSLSLEEFKNWIERLIKYNETIIESKS